MDETSLNKIRSNSPLPTLFIPFTRGTGRQRAREAVTFDLRKILLMTLSLDTALLIDTFNQSAKVIPSSVDWSTTIEKWHLLYALLFS